MPAYRVSGKARQDIRELARYTQRRWGPEQRRRYLTGMQRCFDRLADSPEMAAERREYVPPVRIHRYENHLIVYIVDADGVFVVRVLHESMDVPGRLSDP